MSCTSNLDLLSPQLVLKQLLQAKSRVSWWCKSPDTVQGNTFIVPLVRALHTGPLHTDLVLKHCHHCSVERGRRLVMKQHMPSFRDVVLRCVLQLMAFRELQCELA